MQQMEHLIMQNTHAALHHAAHMQMEDLIMQNTQLENPCPSNVVEAFFLTNQYLH